MLIRTANLQDKEKVLKIVDEFNDYANSVSTKPVEGSSHFSIDNSGELFEKIVHSSQSVIFIALNDKEIIGYLEVHKVIRLRKANYYGEIESMFVKESYRGQGVAVELMKAAIDWGYKEKMDCMRLYSGYGLDRAHAFYEKMGFKNVGKTYRYILTSKHQN